MCRRLWQTGESMSDPRERGCHQRAGGLPSARASAIASKVENLDFHVM